MSTKNEIYANESPLPAVEGEILLISGQFEGVRDLTTGAGKVFLDEEEITSTVFISGDAIGTAENVLTLKKLTVRVGDGGGVYVVVFEATSDGVNFEKRKLILEVQAPETE